MKKLSYWILPIATCALCFSMGWVFGYINGNHSADRWYAEHPNAVITTPPLTVNGERIFEQSIGAGDRLKCTVIRYEADKPK